MQSPLCTLTVWLFRVLRENFLQSEGISVVVGVPIGNTLDSACSSQRPIETVRKGVLRE